MRRRRLHRRERKLRNKKIIIACICLICIMSVGFAAFQTNISLKAKGNVKETITIEGLKQTAVTSGDGLYEDTFENNRYIYRGTNPNNYIQFNNDIYRIISIENDNTLKVMKLEPISATSFDSSSNRYQSEGYCSGTYNNNYCGCNVWGSKTTMLDSVGNNITSFPITYNSTTFMDLPDKEAEINTYLNNTFYNSLNNYQKYVVSHTWYVGRIVATSLLSDIVNAEKEYLWKGRIGLISVSDYEKASLNDNCKNEPQCEGSASNSCSTNNYLYFTSVLRTITPTNWHDDITSRCVIATIKEEKGGRIITITANSSSSDYKKYYPSFYLDINTLTGKGTESQPYTIIN